MEIAKNGCETAPGLISVVADHSIEYDIAPDGRFLAIKPAEEQQPVELHIILSWLDHVKSKLTQ
ncbi:hypothetical protein L0156_03270 [bacterium]|nr:hypothetical protein [bacterium]